MFELLFIFVLIGSGAAGSGLLGSSFGTAGYVFGFIGGAAAPPAVLFIISTVSDFLFRGIPVLPICRQGKCKGTKDYQLQKLSGHVYAWQCNCGDLYLKRGRRFQHYKDGQPTPYLIWIPFRGWILE